MLYIADPALAAAVAGIDLAEIAITSDLTLANGHAAPVGGFSLPDVPGVTVVFAKAQGKRCARSWKILPDVGSDPEYPDVSPRDAQALRERAAAGL